jgi:purine-nucleoside phosphorylase
MVHELLQESTAYIRSISHLKPRVGIILGSGFTSFENQIKEEARIPFDEIPNFVTNGDGADGSLILGRVQEVPVAALIGRLHFYEGHPMDRVVFPTRVLAMLGIETLILTNAAGGLDADMAPGDFMIIKDHINLMGDNPLKGPNLKNLGPRFPEMSQPYDLHLVERMSAIMKAKNIPHHIGVYCGVSGPTFETPAEVRFLRLIGGNAVGMSTVPESIAANHLGLRVAAICCITNEAGGGRNHKLSHQTVTETAKKSELPFKDFLTDFIQHLGSPHS